MVPWLLLPLLAAPPTRPPAADDFAAVVYHFDEAAGDATDAGLFGLHARVSGASRVDGPFGTALATAHGGATLRDVAALEAGEALTLECWARVDGPGDDLQRIAFRSSAYGLYLNPQGTTLTFYANVSGEWTGVNAPMPQRRWVHLAGIFDGEMVRLLIDGAQVAETPRRGRLVANGAAFEIGGEVGAQRRFLNGAVDEVRVSLVARDDFDTPLRYTPTVQARPVALPSGEMARLVPEVTLGRAATPPAIDGKLDDPVWRNALRLDLRDSAADVAITQPTTAWLAWDDQRLYLATEASEAKMAQLKADATAPDGDVWNDDAIEFFVRRPDGVYHHLAINANGAIFDSRNTPQAEVGWNSGAQVATQRLAQAWSMELAVPWASFGDTDLNRPWRGNVCRSRPGGENSSWAAVGGRFHSPGKFGVWRFAEQASQPAETTSMLWGELRDPDGRRMPNVAVQSATGVAVTDGWGRFRFDGLPRETVMLAITSPRYRGLAAEVDLRQPVERVVLSGLETVDPNRLDLAVPPSPDGFHAYAIEPLDDYDPSALPATETGRAPLTAFACAGEKEPLGAVMVASQALSQVTLSCAGLQGPGGATIPADRIAVHPVKRILMRNHYARPADDVSPRDRYLMPNEPFAMPANTFRRVHLLVDVPSDTAPGEYTGALRIEADGKSVALPLRLTVLPLALAAPSRHYSIYYRQPLNDATEPLVRRELADLRAHGADRVLWAARLNWRKADDGTIRVDYSALEPYVAMQLEYGFQGPLIVHDGLEQLAQMTDGETGQQFLAEAKKGIVAMRAYAQAKGWPELVLTHMDEVFGEGRLERYINLAKAIRQVPEQRLYITFHSQPKPAVAEMTKQILPYVDIRCYHGHSLDWWIAAGHTWDELAADLQATGDEAWCYYNLRGAPETAEWARLTNGFWLWLTPVACHVPWAYNSWKGDPLDDADGYDFGYAFPVGDRIIGTRQWEGYREGIDDLRYLTTLESRLAAAKQQGGKAAQVAEAEAWLTDLRKTLMDVPLVEEQSAIVKPLVAKYGEADYDAWRRKAAELAMALD